ncbi:DUF3048 domain-containing protein, partial [bacterium]
MVKKISLSLVLVTLLSLAAACSPTAVPSQAPTPAATQDLTATAFQPATATATAAATATPTLAPTAAYPAEGVGPSSYPDGYDPLTGLAVSDASLLDRRPVIVKVENLPRDDRPQWGLPQADLIYEYYT